MQAATDAASAHTLSSYHPIYAVPSANPSAGDAERHALKRSYLRLLPHPQLVELCLTFEAYSPPHLKDSLWPYDLKAAVAALQAHQSAPPPPPPAAPIPTHHTPVQTPENVTSATPASSSEAKSAEPPPMGSLADDSPPERSSAQPQNGTSNAPSTLADALAAAMPSTANASVQEQASSQPPPPQPVASTSTVTPAPQTQPSYPHGHGPFGPYAQQTAYPHAPYYPPPHNYMGQYPPPPGTAQYPPAPGFPPHGPYPLPHPPGSPFTSTPLTRMPPPDPNSVPDGLPSYEDMIVEALADLGDPEGCAPKALFTWMASHYPLHTNFRPSASQALQKAYKRGRLEKSSNGKYRLNVNWDGPQSTKRTTRRPQTLSQIASGPHSAPTSSPFTHAPLAVSKKAGTPRDSPAPVQQQPPYPGVQYPHATYPGFQPFAPPAPPAEQQGAAQDEEVGEGTDAWEAAQSILKAINFGSLLQSSDASAAAEPSEPVAAAAPADAPAFTVLSEQDRAALQGQLALLAAQLAEIADEELKGDLGVAEEDGEEDVDVDVEIEDAGPAVGIFSGGVYEEEEEEEDDDEDMDMVPVPIPGDAASRT